MSLLRLKRLHKLLNTLSKEPEGQPALSPGKIAKSGTVSVRNMLSNKPENHLANNPAFIASESKLFAPIEELFIAGGGGAGRSLPAALEEAMRYGLDLNNVKAVCATSVGSILALALVMGIPIKEMFRIQQEMPADRFQDWSFPGCFINFPSTWGWCKGEAMPAYFRKFIHDWTGLEDPTFLELYEAGYTKELRVVTTNLNKMNLTLLSHKMSPDTKVADGVALSCSVPLLFPPKLIVSPEGRGEWHIDGGVVKNYPFGVGSDDLLSLDKQLGFIFVSRNAFSEFLDEEYSSPIQNFIQYVKTWASMLIFQHPLSLHDPIKQRTIAIRVDHNPLVFTASTEQQNALNQSGREGVHSFVAQMVKNRKPKPLLFHPRPDLKSHAYSIDPSKPELLKHKVKLRAMPLA